jgi:non-ribosomal peptide synthetase component F
VVLSPGSLGFGSQTVGTTSVPQTVTITNQNVTSIVMGDISATDDFIVSAKNCPATLGPTKSCTIQVEFAPDETGAATGTVYISDDDSASPQKVSLGGTGK